MIEPPIPPPSKPTIPEGADPQPTANQASDTHVAIYVNWRRRNTSGVLHEELHRKTNVEDWELAAVFSASGNIELHPKRPDNAQWHLVVDGEKRTARQLLVGDLPESTVRVWHGAGRTDCIAVYRRKVDGSVVFGTDLRRVFGRGLAYEPLAVFCTSAEILHERPFGRESVLNNDFGEWTAEQILRGEGPPIPPVYALWRKPKR